MEGGGGERHQPLSERIWAEASGSGRGELAREGGGGELAMGCAGAWNDGEAWGARWGARCLGVGRRGHGWAG